MGQKALRLTSDQLPLNDTRCRQLLARFVISPNFQHKFWPFAIALGVAVKSEPRSGRDLLARAGGPGIVINER